jgi:hypothetical protein
MNDRHPTVLVSPLIFQTCSFRMNEVYAVISTILEHKPCNAMVVSWISKTMPSMVISLTHFYYRVTFSHYITTPE